MILKRYIYLILAAKVKTRQPIFKDMKGLTKPKNCPEMIQIVSSKESLVII